MKKLLLPVVLGATVIAGTAYAVDCNAIPNCSDLGYTDNVSDCPKTSNGKNSVIKCPFDKTKGKCIFEAAVGEIAYFTKAPNSNSGWLKCNGSRYTRSKYPDLGAFLGTQFCSNAAHYSSSCSSIYFAVPNYSGYFLRVAGTPKDTYGKVGNSTLTTPQKEGIPDLTGQMTVVFRAGSEPPANDLGVFYYDDYSTSTKYTSGSTSFGQGNLHFRASRVTSVYGGSKGVTPVNIAVYAYIFAGRIVD